MLMIDYLWFNFLMVVCIVLWSLKFRGCLEIYLKIKGLIEICLVIGDFSCVVVFN